MELRRLRYFLAVAEELSFTKAAIRLHISQQPLSVQIKQLEDELDAPLFLRSNNGVKLTPAGRALYEEAQKVFAQVDLAVKRTKQSAAGIKGTLRVGFCPALFETLLAHAIAVFAKERPQVQITLRGIPTAEQYLTLEKDEIDLGFCGGPSDPERFETEALAVEPYLAMMRTEIAKERLHISIGELAEHPLLLLSGEANLLYRHQIERIFADRPYVIRQEAHDKPMLLQLVQTGIGTAILPQHTATTLPEGVVALNIKDVKENYSLVAAWKRGLESCILQHAFLSVMKEVIQSHPEALPWNRHK